MQNSCLTLVRPMMKSAAVPRKEPSKQVASPSIAVEHQPQLWGLHITHLFAGPVLAQLLKKLIPRQGIVRALQSGKLGEDELPWVSSGLCAGCWCLFHLFAGFAGV